MTSTVSESEEVFHVPVFFCPRHSSRYRPLVRNSIFEPAFLFSQEVPANFDRVASGGTALSVALVGTFARSGSKDCVSFLSSASTCSAPSRSPDFVNLSLRALRAVAYLRSMGSSACVRARIHEPRSEVSSPYSYEACENREVERVRKRAMNLIFMVIIFIGEHEVSKFMRMNWLLVIASIPR